MDIHLEPRFQQVVQFFGWPVLEPREIHPEPMAQPGLNVEDVAEQSDVELPELD